MKRALVLLALAVIACRGRKAKSPPPDAHVKWDDMCTGNPLAKGCS